jgi:hypothetical protein
MQCAGLAGAAISNAQNNHRSNEFYYFSVKEQLELSSNENIIVFLLDKLDTNFLDEVLEKHSEITDILEGFTYYRNNLATSSGTYPSVAHMLSNEPFVTSMTRDEYLTKAWDNTRLFDMLYTQNYRRNMLLSGATTYVSPEQLIGKVDNIRVTCSSNRTFIYAPIVMNVFFTAQTKFAPYSFKNFMIASNPFGGNESYIVRNVPDYFPTFINSESDLLFYNHLVTSGLRIGDSENTFSFVHFNAAHEYFLYDENLELVHLPRNLGILEMFSPSRRAEFLAEEHTRRIAQTRGCFKILEEYFSQLKSLGIYDNSTIILIADHGNSIDWTGDWQNPQTNDNRPISALLIKPQNSGNEPLKINSTAELSNSNFIASIAEILGEGTDEFGPSWFDIESRNISQIRTIYLVQTRNFSSANYRGRYVINGDAHIPDNWTFINE